MAKLETVKLSTLKPLPEGENPNAHTERGQYMLETSLERNAWIDAGTLANDGSVLSGNARVDALAAKGVENVQIIETDGKTPIFIKRTDIPNAQDPRAKEIAIAANRVHQVSYSPDADVIASLMESDAEMLRVYHRDDELAEILAGLEVNTDKDTAPLLYDSKFAVLIECDSESHQLELLERFTNEQIKCKALIV